MSGEHGTGSGIGKIPTGIEGFDEITGGGLPRNRTTLVLGQSGTGKTVFALQTLVNGARRWGEPGIFVAFEESSRHIIANARSFGWDLEALEREKLFFLDARMPPDIIQAGAFDLLGMLASLSAKAQEMGARRIVFDAVDVLLSLLNDPIAERQELYRLHDWLRESGLTGIVTLGTVGNDTRSESLRAHVTFMSDCVVLLDRRVADRVSLRTLRIAKYRGSGFAENEFPVVIGPKGIDVASFGITTSALDYPVSTQRVSTGLEQLDGMLRGGYLRGTSVLVTGAPGTAKSTMAGAFVLSALQRGERALYVSFDEGAGEIARNLASVNITLQPHVDSGALRVYSVRGQASSAEEHLIRLRAVVAEHRPQCMVIDPLSAMLKAGGEISALAVAQRLLHMTKTAGITLLVTSLVESGEPEVEAAALRVSTIADTWLHLSYVVQGGERNRALTIVKSRGTGHSNQVRELVLTDEGLVLSDVYTAGGQVLMGTLRWEREEQSRRERERLDAEYRRERAALEAAEAETAARIEALRRALVATQAQLEVLDGERSRLEDERAALREGLRQRRRADSPADAAYPASPPEEGA